MFIPLWVLIGLGLLVAALLAWGLLAAAGRNPLPFPDPGSRIFAAASGDAKDALLAVLANHGLHERFQMDSSGIKRSILWDGTIINVSPPAVVEKLGGASSCIGLVAGDPEAAAVAAADLLRSRGFEARVVLDAEPNLPVAFVVTNAMTGSVLNFRKHLTRMPRPPAGA